ncbi:uncharacterized protein DUF560 [Breoghania corrubedonensis]|uniref:Uncharacterized protein DUF560 n=1 Tax=Breoghania corrubedonensis TaxID=665038 RepID=A0A2T5VE89_9HYPH|nr:tetratricopeptide repeat protein [Breoghania corrubedonensis]PTW62068.1 uncharacterized protein DUF560 [Breoghania corrubedonensis]
MMQRLGAAAAKVLFLGMFAAGVLCLPALPVNAQSPQANAPKMGDAGDLEVRRQQLLRAMLAEPDNLDIAFSYAALSARAGDFEAAISTLERMLIYAPGLPRVQLELGVLYYRLGAFDVAKQYFDAAVSAPDVPREVRERVNIYQAGIAQAQAPAKFSAAVIVGARWQSNANAAPGDRSVTLNGLDFLLNESAVSQSDFNAYLATTAHVSYDLARQGDLLEADLLFYGARYAELSRLHTEIAEVTVGPSFNMARFGWDEARLGVYAILGGVRLDEANYSGTLGAGARLAWLPRIRSRLESKSEFRRRWFNDSPTYPSVSDRNGYRISSQLAYTYFLTAGLAVRGAVSGAREDTKTDAEDYFEAGVSAGLRKTFASPLKVVEQAWFVDLDAGYVARWYDVPDSAINAADSQKDDEYWLRSTLTVPVAEDWALMMTGEYRRAVSNYPTDDYANGSVSVSVMKKF